MRFGFVVPWEHREKPQSSAWVGVRMRNETSLRVSARPFNLRAPGRGVLLVVLAQQLIKLVMAEA